MRFKNGSAKTLYMVTDQETGSIIAFTSLRARKQYLASWQQHSHLVLSTYDLREAK
jgi:hypothetical protein